MMAYERSENAREDFGLFIYPSQTETMTLIRKLERILIKLYRQNVSLQFNQTCLNEWLLPNYTHTHTHIWEREREREREKMSLLLCLRGRQFRYLAGAVFLFSNFSLSEAFAGEVLVLGEISFLILLSLVLTSDVFKYLTLKTSVFIEDSPGNKYLDWITNHRSFRILLLIFSLVSQLNTLIYVCGKSILSTYQIWISHPIKP